MKLIDLPWPEGVTARHLRDLAIHPATGLVYVVESYEDVVHVLQDLDVVATIPAGGRFLKYVTVDPASPYLYVTSGTGIDGMKNTVVTVLSGTEVAGYIPLGYQPYSQFYNSVEQATYIGYYGKHIGEPMDDPPRNGVLAIVKGTEIITRTQLGYPENREINKMAVNAHTGEMYFIESDTSLIYRSATGELSRLRLKALGYGTLRDVVIDAKRGWAYVGAWKTGADRILVIERDQILAELPVATDPLALAMDETHDYVYVASRLANVFTVIRGTEVITAMRHDGIGSSQIVVDEAKGYIYVMNPDYGGRVSIFRVGVAQRQPTFWETFLPWVQSR